MQKVCSTRLDHFLKGHVRKNSLLHFRCTNKADSGAINVCRRHILGILVAIATENHLECTETVQLNLGTTPQMLGHRIQKEILSNVVD